MMSTPTSIREAHEAFVSGHSGSSAPDLILAVYPAIPASLLAVVIVQGRTGWLWFLLESIFLVVPLTLSFTICSDYALELCTVLTILTALALCLATPTGTNVCSPSKKARKHLGCVTSLRALLNLATSIAILGVDFHSFPRRFAKTEEYGYSLMDVGAAGFVTMNGIVEGKKRASYRFVARDTVILTVLGVLRLVLARASNYQHHVTEYGLHGNFFFTLALIKLTCSWWIWHLNSLGSVMVALLLSFCHHLFLTVGNGGPWTLSNIGRDTLILANREWLVSVPGYTILYFLGAALGSFLFSRSVNTKLSFPLFILTAWSGVCLAGLHFFVDLPSRRLGNPTFVALVIFFTMIVLTLFSLVEERLKQLLPGMPSVPLTFLAINHKPLLFFLLSNISTGLINKSINTLDVTYPWDVGIIVIYATLLVNVIYFIFITDVG